ncbi:unnamed protein product [Heterobilharzia americana]|nr:unnamed protein product [Heterobilharzia americana]
MDATKDMIALREEMQQIQMWQHGNSTSNDKVSRERTTNDEDGQFTEVELSTDIGVHYRIPRKILNDLHTSVNELRYDLNNLDSRLSKRTDRLNIGYQCFMHLAEFAELRGWLQECEDLLLLESRASRDTTTAKTELKKHANIEFRVNNLLANCAREFSECFARFVEGELRSLDPISLSPEFTVNITDQFVHSPGFAVERIARVMNMCRCLICTKHSDSPRIAFWQDILLETWADLRELIHSRVKLLVSTAHRFIFITRCSETLKLVQEKFDQLSQSTGKDVQVICKQLSLLSAFEQDVQALQPLVKWVENAADCLLPLYSGQWIKRLRQPRDNLLSLWCQLRQRTKLRRIRLKRAIALYRWISNLDILFNWIQHCQKELERIEMDIWNVNLQTMIRNTDNM